MSPHRDPDTGQFLPGSGGDLDRFDEIVQQRFQANFSVAAADLDGTTGERLGQTVNWEGEELYDMEEVIDRFDLSAMLWAYHRIVTYIGSTQTADGTVRAMAEISSSPSRTSVIRNVQDTASAVGDQQSGDNLTVNVGDGEPASSETDDTIGPNLLAVGFGPITDGTNGVGGAGTAGWVEWEGPVMVEPVFDDRDSVFYNGTLEHSNVSDAAIHVDVAGWHVHGILEE